MRILAASTLVLVMLLGACSKQDAHSSPEASTTAKTPVAEAPAATPAPQASTPAAQPSTASQPSAPAKAEAVAAAAEPAPAAVQPAAQEEASNTEEQYDGSMVLARYQEGVHYEELKQPVKTITGNKIEVTEVFSYACIHCFHFETVVKAWKSNMPEGVEFVQMPAAFNAVWEHYARIFYTAKALGKLDELHPIIFKAMHVQRKRLRDEDEIAKVFAEAGVDEATFKSTFKSFGVSSQVQIADSRTRSFGTTGTPEVIVDGRYRVTSGKAGSHENMFKVVDFLVDKIKAERGSKK